MHDEGEIKTEYDYEILSELHEYMMSLNEEAIILGEANVLPEEHIEYFGPDRDRLDMLFNFFVNQHMFYALATGDVAPLKKALEATYEVPEMAEWVEFLRTHDELDLGRLTEEQRAKVYRQFGPEQSMQLYNRGIRRRLAPMLGDDAVLRLAFSITFSLPGSSMIRYGDELGMGDDLSLNERLAVRTPMQWNDEKNAGFSTAKSLIRPVVDKGPYSYETLNVEAAIRDNNSLLNFVRRLVYMRKECAEVSFGKMSCVDVSCEQVLALRYDWKGKSLLVLHNFSTDAQQVKIDEDDIRTLFDLFTEESIDYHQGEPMALKAHGYKWYRINGTEKAS
jgi:maltose alpha-D-glucosyltransferase/alpha-amylase